MAANVRKPEELQNPDYNYFIAFKVDATEKNAKKIEQNINSITGGAASTSGSIYIRRLIELKKDAIEVLCNDATYNASTDSYTPNSGARQREADAAKKMKLDDAVKVVELICLHTKKLFKSDVIKITGEANKAAKYFTADELWQKVAYLQQQGVKLYDNASRMIPFADYRKVDALLEALQMTSLYDFLEISFNASIDDIKRAKTEIYTKGQKFVDKKKKQAYSNLCSEAEKILTKTPESRKNYDNYLKLKTQVWDEFERRKTYGVKELSMEEYLSYAKIVRDELGISVDDTEKLLAEGMANWVLTLTGKGEGVDLAMCPYEGCGKLYPAGAKLCPHCGKPLEVACWNCGGRMPFTLESKVCPTCKVSYQAKDLFNQRLSAVEALFRQPRVEIPALKNILIELKNVVPGYQTQPNSYAAKRIAEQERIIQEKIKEEETLGVKYREADKEIQAYVTKKQYQMAGSLAQKLRAQFPGYQVESTNKRIAEINAVLAKAQQQIATAKTYMAQRNEEKVLAAAAAALEICADYGEAQQILQKYPPAAPTGFQVRTVDDSFARLEWVKQGSQNMTTYTVIKKVGAKPTSADDGAVVESGLSINFYEDENIASATPYYYAVYAERCGIRSALVSSPTPVQFFLDITNLRQEVVEGMIKVQWDCPPNVKAVEVWKNNGPVAPTRLGEGTRVACDKNGFTDSNCDGQCAYLIVCKYEVGNQTMASKGVRRAFKKYEMLTPLQRVEVGTLEDGTFTFKCAENKGGTVKLYMSAERLACRYDTVMKTNTLAATMRGASPVSVSYDAAQNMTFRLPADRILWIYPVLSNDQLFIVSTPVLVNTAEGIKNVSYSENNGTVTIRGTLNASAKTVIAKVSNNKFPKTMEDEGEKFTATRDQFNATGSFELKLKSNTVNYITLFVEMESGGKTTISRGVSLSDPIDYREKVVVKYALDYEVNRAKPFKVKVLFGADSPEDIPAFLIMKGDPCPMNKSQGELVEKVEGIRLKKKGLFNKSQSKFVAEFTITVPADSVRMKFVIFPCEDNNHVKLKVVRPNSI